MNSNDEVIGRSALKIAGLLDEIQRIWNRRLEDYFVQLESLISGEWFDSNDMIGLLREASQASKEALKGLGMDLSAELMQSSSGVLSRFQSEKTAMIEEINDLRESYARAVSRDGDTIRQENESLMQAIKSIPSFRLLSTIQELHVTNYKELSKKASIKTSLVRKYVKELVKRSYVFVDKSKRPHQISFVSAPWSVFSFNKSSRVMQMDLVKIDAPGIQ